MNCCHAATLISRAGIPHTSLELNNLVRVWCTNILGINTVCEQVTHTGNFPPCQVATSGMSFSTWSTIYKDLCWFFSTVSLSWTNYISLCTQKSRHLSDKYTHQLSLHSCLGQIIPNINYLLKAKSFDFPAIFLFYNVMVPIFLKYWLLISSSLFIQKNTRFTYRCFLQIILIDSSTQRPDTLLFNINITFNISN